MKKFIEEGEHEFYGKHDSLLTEEDYTVLLDGVIEGARPVLNARKIAGTSTKLYGEYKRRIKYRKLVDFATAWSSFVLETRLDALNLTEHFTHAPIHQQTWIIEDEEIGAARLNGESVEATAARIAGETVQLQEEKMIIAGIAELGINGMYASAGIDNATAYNFTTWKDTLKAVGKCIKLLKDQNQFGPYNLTLPNAHHEELLDSISTHDKLEIDLVKARLNLGKENNRECIFMNPNLVAGTGMVTVEPRYKNFALERCLELTLRTEDRSEESGRGIFCRAYAINILLVKVATAIAKISNITVN